MARVKHLKPRVYGKDAPLARPTAECTKCNRRVHRRNFPAIRRYGLVCIDCLSRMPSKGRRKLIDPNAKKVRKPPANTRQCPRCEAERPRYHFVSNGVAQEYCGVCRAAGAPVFA